MSEFEMSWMDAIKRVLREEGPMSCENITKTIIDKEYRRNYGDTPRNSVNLFLNNGRRIGVFRKNENREWELIDTSVTAPSSHKKAVVGVSVSLRDLVVACIETIGRKCFDVQELCAFAPIFEVCVPECKNLENALKQALDELVKEGLIDALPNDCYRNVKLE